MKTTFVAVLSRRRLVWSFPPLVTLWRLALIVVLTLLFTVSLQADAPPTTLHLARSGADTEGLATYRLEWNAVSNATYVVQSATDLMAPNHWQTIDVVTPTQSAGILEIKGRSIPENSVEYFRLILPQPQIFAVEPANFPPGAPVDAFVIGQCFETNDVVRVDGVALSGVIYVAGGLLECTLPPQSAGLHLVELVRGGVVRSSFTVTCADPLISPELVLQGPPTEPPASPHAKITKSRSNIQNNRLGGWGDQDDDGDGTLDYPPDVSGQKITKSRSNIQNNRIRVDSWASIVEKTTIKDTYPDIDPRSGEVSVQTIDLAIPGRGLDFIWARTYNSRTGPSTAQGQRWDHSYNVSLATQSDGSVLLRPGNGRADAFYPNSTGGWSRPEYFVEIGDLDSDGFPDVVTFADSGKWVFHSLLGGSAPGMLSQIIDRNGNTMRLHYDGAGKLAQVVDDLDRTNTVAYNGAGQLVSIMDFSGRTVRYEYDTNGDLVTCISPPVIGTPNGNDFPGGKTNRFTYTSGSLVDAENHLLLSCVDALGVTTAQFSCDLSAASQSYLRCLSMQRWTNTPTTFSYLPQTPTPANRFATLRCIVNDPVGNVSAISTDARGRCVKLEEFTGRATPGTTVMNTASLPIPKLRSSDPDSYETLAEWNNDSLCNKLVLFGGRQVECTYESDFDSATPAHKRADCRVVRERAANPVDLDGDGVPDVTERAWYKKFDPRFGSGTTQFNGPPRIFILLPSRGGAAGRFGRGPRQTVLLDGSRLDSAYHDDPELFICPSSCDDFVTSATDPRGNVTTGSYDENGNLTATTNTPSTLPFTSGNYPTAQNYSYNPHGQLTAITNAADANGLRRVDTFSYYTNGPMAGYLFDWKNDTTNADDTVIVNFEYDARGNVTRIVGPRGHDELYTHNALDQLVRYQTPTNLTARCTTDFTYDATDNLVESATELRDENDAFVRMIVTRATFDVLDRPVAVVNQVSAGQFVTNRFDYDANNNVVAVHSPLAVSGADSHAITQFAYDERRLPFQTIAAPGSPDQSTTQCDYDANGNVTRVSEGLEGTPRITTMEYDGFAGFHDQSLKKVLGTFTLIGCGLRLSGSSPLQIAAAGTLNQKADLAHGGNCGEHAYSLQFEHGNPDRPVVLGSEWGMKNAMQGITGQHISQITDPNGNVTTFNYDANDNLKVARHFGQLNDTPGTNGNVRLAEARWKYDGLDRTTEARTAFFNPATQTAIGDGASVTTFAYAPNGQCTNVTDDLGRATTFAYDTVGRHISTTSAGAKTITVTLRDAAGNATRSTQTDVSDLGGPPQVFTRTNVYDSLNRLISTVDNVGNTNRYAYDSASRVVRTTDAKGNVRGVSYDDLNRQTLAIGDLNSNGLLDVVVDVNTSWAYDANSRLVSVTDDNTNTTYYAYDSLGRQVLATSPAGTAHAFLWNVSNDLVREQDANGTVITNSYDLLGRCVRRDITPGAGVAATTTFETFAYDGASRLVAATNDVSHSEFEYDSLGRNTRGVSGGIGALARVYDGVGNCLAMTYPSGRIVTYAYDALNQVTNVSSSASAMTPPTTVASFAYEGPGREGRIVRANGVNTRINWNGLVSPPNAAGDFGRGQVSSINHQVAGGGAVIDRRVTAYDRNQNKTLRAQTAPFYVGGPMATNLFAYDALNRMTDFARSSGSTDDYVQIYVLDGNGNRQTVFSNGVPQSYVMDATIPPADFQMDQYTMTPFAGQAFDENGNLIAKNSTVAQLQYQHDYANRLVAVNDLFTGVPEPVASYSYNALGQRISKTTYPPSPLAPVTTEFWYDRDFSGDGVPDLMIETRQSGALIDSFIHNPDDGLLVASANGAGALRYYHSDDLGNVLALTDEFGAVSGRTDYADFGMPIFLTNDGTPIATNASPIGNSFLFHGLEWDAETRLYHGGSGDDIAVTYTAKTGKTGKAKQSLRYADPNTGRGVGTSGGNFGDNNPWSDGRIVRKMIPITIPDITGAQRRVSVNGSGAGSAHGRQLLYTAKQGKSGKTSGK